MSKDTKRIAENVTRKFTAARISSGWYESRGIGRVTVWVKARSSAELLSLVDAGSLVSAANNHLMKIMKHLDMKRGHMDFIEYVGAEGDRVYGLAMRRFTPMEDTEMILTKRVGLNKEMP